MFCDRFRWVRERIIGPGFRYIGGQTRSVYIRLSAEWMTKADERILEYLAVEDMAQPKMISDDDRVMFEGKYINQRLNVLLNAGFVQRVGHGLYRITEQGDDYLTGEFDARDLEEPD